jgi:hypothetical protein
MTRREDLTMKNMKDMKREGKDLGQATDHRPQASALRFLTSDLRPLTSVFSPPHPCVSARELRLLTSDL